jgi:hypothetical protein
MSRITLSFRRAAEREREAGAAVGHERDTGAQTDEMELANGNEERV